MEYIHLGDNWYRLTVPGGYIYVLKENGVVSSCYVPILKSVSSKLTKSQSTQIIELLKSAGKDGLTPEEVSFKLDIELLRTRQLLSKLKKKCIIMRVGRHYKII